LLNIYTSSFNLEYCRKENAFCVGAFDLGGPFSKMKKTEEHF